MRLTEKDKKVIELIEKWGFVTAEDLRYMLGLKDVTGVKWRLNRLVENGLLSRGKVFVVGKFVYFKGSLQKIDIANYDHDQRVKILAKVLADKLCCDYITEKELRREARQETGIVGLTKKIPDLLLVKDGIKIAVEVELSQKDKKRQTKNIEHYVNELSAGKYNQVFYYCGSDAIKSRLKMIVEAKNMSNYIKTELISSILPEDWQKSSAIIKK